MDPININTITWVNGRTRLNQTNMNQIEANLTTIAGKVNELVAYANSGAESAFSECTINVGLFDAINYLVYGGNGYESMRFHSDNVEVMTVNESAALCKIHINLVDDDHAVESYDVIGFQAGSGSDWANYMFEGFLPIDSLSGVITVQGYVEIDASGYGFGIITKLTSVLDQGKASAIVPAYDIDVGYNYNVGDLVLYDGDMYRCTQQQQQSDFDPNCWQQTNLQTLLDGYAKKGVPTVTAAVESNDEFVIRFDSFDNLIPESIVLGLNGANNDNIVLRMWDKINYGYEAVVQPSGVTLETDSGASVFVNTTGNDYWVRVHGTTVNSIVVKAVSFVKVNDGFGYEI